MAVLGLYHSASQRVYMYNKSVPVLADSRGMSDRTALLASLTWLPRSSSFLTVMPPRPLSLPTASDRLGIRALLAVLVRCVATCEHQSNIGPMTILCLECAAAITAYHPSMRRPGGTPPPGLNVLQ